MAHHAKGRDSYLVADVRQIDALASPVRQDILDTLMALGPSTIAEVAAALRRSAAGLYYHVEQLESVGLVRSVDEIDESGRSAVRLELPGALLSLHYEPKDARNRQAVGRVVATMLRSAQRSFRRAFSSGHVTVSGPRRNLWAARLSGALNATELEEFNRHLRRAMRVLQAAREQPERRTATPLYDFTFVLSPRAATAMANDERKAKRTKTPAV